MTVAPILLGLLEEIVNDQYTDEIKTLLKEQIKSVDGDVSSNPRDKTDGNLKLLNATMLIVLGLVEDLYGAGDDAGIHPFPLFEAQPYSQIVPLINDPQTFAIVLGTYVHTWEDAFYDVCHESLHLLNPIANVKDKKVAVSALEEGCAVKFAEQMYEKYIKPICNKIPLASPVNAIGSQYFAAYAAAKKIPDCVLKEVRGIFGRFSKIDDAEKFGQLVCMYVNKEEVEILMRPFVYKRA